MERAAGLLRMATRYLSPASAMQHSPGMPPAAATTNGGAGTLCLSTSRKYYEKMKKKERMKKMIIIMNTPLQEEEKKERRSKGKKEKRCNLSLTTLYLLPACYFWFWRYLHLPFFLPSCYFFRAATAWPADPTPATCMAKCLVVDMPQHRPSLLSVLSAISPSWPFLNHGRLAVLRRAAWHAPAHPVPWSGCSPCLLTS